MANNVNNVTVGKPVITGAIFRAPYGTTLPEDCTTALAEAFKCMGYIGDTGVRNNNSPTSQTTKAWGGDIVLDSQTEKPDKFGFKLLEVLNPDVLKAVYGDSNVDGTLATGLEVHANSGEVEAASWVIEMILRDNTAKRIVIPNAKVSSLAEITYNDSDAVAYDVEITAFPDEDGNTHHEYMKSTTPSV